MPMGVNDYIRLLDQDLADAVKALRIGLDLVQRSRMRMIHLMGAARRHPKARVLKSMAVCSALESALMANMRPGHRMPRQRVTRKMKETKKKT